jgi:proton-dependent oligopeptide transporter, POT family
MHRKENPTVTQSSSGVQAEPQAALDHSFFGHPRGLATLFGTELWERFSFYGMRVLLVLFLAAPAALGGIGLSAALAAGIYAVYSSLVYLVTLPGGWLADRLLGARKAVLWGAVIITAGHFAMALPLSWTIWLGLGLIVAGTGLLKANISAIVGGLYGQNDARRDAGFSIFYMGINIGAFVAPLVTAYLGQKINWHVGFGAAGVGMLVGLVTYLSGQRHLGEVGLHPARPLSAPERQRALGWVVGVLAVLALLIGGLAAAGQLTPELIVNAITVLAFVVTVGYFWFILRDKSLSAVDRSRMQAFIWLFIAAAMFWMIYDQGGSVLQLFADRQTRTSILGYDFPSGWFQSINPLAIIVLAPVFGALWVRLGRRNPSTPVKFTFGLAGIGLSFVLMAVAAASVAGGGQASPWWLVAVFLIQTLAELTLSPIGLSMSTKLAPAAFTSQVLGLWFLATAVGDAVGAQVVRGIEKLPQQSYFLYLGGAALVFAAVLLFATGRVRRLMAGVD